MREKKEKKTKAQRNQKAVYHDTLKKTGQDEREEEEGPTLIKAKT